MQIIKVPTSSIEKRAIADLDYAVTYSETSGGGSSVNPNIIELVAGEYIEPNRIVRMMDGIAYYSTPYNSNGAIGISLTEADVDGIVQIQISGIGVLILENCLTNDIYAGDYGIPIDFSYSVGNYLQRIGTKIDNNRILLNIQTPALME
jgi:hypothetical protein